MPSVAFIIPLSLFVGLPGGNSPTMWNDARQTATGRVGRERGVVTDKPTFSSNTVPTSTINDKITAAFKPAGYERVLTRV